MDRLGHKLVALAVIFVSVFVAMALPIKISAWFEKKGKRGLAILSAIMCFGGGIFVGAFLLHMAPEAHESITKTINEPNHIHYPISFAIIGGGFFFMMFLERGTLELQRWWTNRRSPKTAASNGEIATGKNDSRLAEDGGNVQLSTVYVNGSYVPEGAPVEVVKVNGAVGDTKTADDNLESHDQHSHGDAGGHSHVNGKDMAGSLARAIVLLLALSMDCIFEGLSLGIQSTISGVWRMVLTILSHEIAVAFTLGLQLKKHNSSRRTLLLTLAYSLTTPAGIAIGTIIKEAGGQDTNVEMVEGILVAFTGGVFLFVAFFEILRHEITHDAPWVNLIVALLGFGVFAGLMVIHSLSHSHDEDDHHHHNGTDHEHYSIELYQ